MIKEIFFIAGAYGVGKTTLCNKLAQKIGIPSYSASDLISPKVAEQYGARKNVTDIMKNQQALIRAIEELPADASSILLTGHFCIFDKNQKVDRVPEFVFTSINIKKIILLIADPAIVLERLTIRDGISYTSQSINDLMNEEKLLANKYSSELNCSLCTHQMRFDSSDVDILADFLLTKES